MRILDLSKDRRRIHFCLFVGRILVICAACRGKARSSQGCLQGGRGRAWEGSLTRQTRRDNSPHVEALQVLYRDIATRRGYVCYYIQLLSFTFCYIDLTSASLGLRVFEGQVVSQSVGQLSTPGSLHASRLVVEVQHLDRDVNNGVNTAILLLYIFPSIVHFY